MKVSYKIALPLVTVITVMIWFVTDRFNTTQNTIVKQSQENSTQEITKQFEKNKMKTLYDLQKNVDVTSKMIAKVSVNDMWNFTYENLFLTLSQYLELDFIEAIEVYEILDAKPLISVGKVSNKLKKIQKKVMRENGEVIGYVKIYYDVEYIKEYFQNSKQQLLKRIEISNLEQDQHMKKLIEQRTYLNLTITFIVLFLLLLTVYMAVVRPLKKLEKGLGSFFNYLQSKTDSVEKIDLKDNDEFGRMGTTLNENIAVTAKLHEEIHQLNINLEEKIQERTKQLQEKSEQVSQLLDNAEEGFLSFSQDLLINSEYSKECESIFHQDITSLNISSLLYPKENEDKELFIKVMGDIFNPKIQRKRKQVFLHLLPNEFLIFENYVKVQYKIISDNQLMLVLVDITERKKLEEKLEREKKVLKMVVSVVSDMDEFKEIIKEFKEFCDNSDQYIKDEKLFLNGIVEYYREVHTFKGNFAQKDLLYVVEKLHHYESKINDLLKDTNRSFDQFKQLITENDLAKWLDEDIEIIESILDQDILKENNTINVPEALIEKMENDIHQILKFPKDQRDVTYEDLVDDVIKMRRDKLSEFFKSYPKYVQKLASRLGKTIYTLKVIGGEDIYVSDKIHPFTKTLVHIFRNSLDHGIETMEERLDSNKDQNATISCNIEKNNENLFITIMDDGKGIDIDSIKKKALEKELYSEDEIGAMSKDEIMMIIFSDTFSTKDVVTQLSGRGVGLGAVKGEIEKLGGDIKIDSTLSKGTTFKFTIPLKNIL